MFVDRALIFFIKSLQQILRVLPERTCISAGRLLGKLAFVFMRYRKKIALSNLKRVFKDLPDAEINSIAKSNFEKFGINVIEFLLMPFITDKEIPARFSMEGKHHLEEALQKGKGAIMLAFHFANWEVTGIISKLLGHDIVALARPPKRRALLNDFLNNLRASTGVTIIVNENTGKEVMKLQ